jgi:hypothetical protein
MEKKLVDRVMKRLKTIDDKKNSPRFGIVDLAHHLSHFSETCKYEKDSLLFYTAISEEVKKWIEEKLLNNRKQIRVKVRYPDEIMNRYVDRLFS